VIEQIDAKIIINYGSNVHKNVNKISEYMDKIFFTVINNLDKTDIKNSVKMYDYKLNNNNALVFKIEIDNTIKNVLINIFYKFMNMWMEYRLFKRVNYLSNYNMTRLLSILLSKDLLNRSGVSYYDSKITIMKYDRVQDPRLIISNKNCKLDKISKTIEI
jgi:hypothetical protein